MPLFLYECTQCGRCFEYNHKTNVNLSHTITCKKCEWACNLKYTSDFPPEGRAHESRLQEVDKWLKSRQVD